MGVVHKLKPEIVDFVIKNKTDDPSLSCRTLSALVQEAFQTKVSKSAINKIIKEENLSSPIGRRKEKKTSGRGKAAKRFKLPEQKKNRIFKDIASHPILSDLKDRLQERDLIDGIGAIFLKAAEWELSGNPILESILQDYWPEGDKEKIRRAACLLGVLKAFHIDSFEGLCRYDGKGLWCLCGQDAPLSEADVLDVVKRVKDQQEFLLKFSLRAPQIFTLVESFKITLIDGATFFIDGQHVSVWKKSPKGFPVSLGKATDILAETLNNVHSMILNSITPKESSKNQKNKQINDFLNSFINVQSKKIQKIELIGEKDCVLGCFEDIPKMRRSFIAGVWPWEKMFQAFLDATSVFEEGKVQSGIFGQDTTYKDMELTWDVDGRPMKLRGVLVYGPFMKVPFLVLLTNLNPAEVKAEDCILQYAQRWPNLERGTRFLTISRPAQWKEMLSLEKKPFLDLVLGKKPYGKDPIWKVVEQLTFLSDRFSRRQFFPEEYEAVDFSTMQNRFYSLPGKIVRNDEQCLVQLKVSEASPYFRDLVFAVQRLNESNVRNFRSQNVFMSLI